MLNKLRTFEHASLKSVIILKKAPILSHSAQTYKKRAQHDKNRVALSVWLFCCLAEIFEIANTLTGPSSRFNVI